VGELDGREGEVLKVTNISVMGVGGFYYSVLFTLQFDNFILVYMVLPLFQNVE
jgi:hypothetical protein